MIFDSQFLTKDDLKDLKKDTCVFCDYKFNIKKVREEVGEEWFGSHGYEHTAKVLYKSYLISDLNLYTFNFEFDETTKDYFKSKETELVEKIKREKEEESPRLRKKLEDKFSQYDLSGEEARIAVDSIIRDYLSELNQEGFSSQSPLEKRIEKLFHNLQLGDLRLVFKDGGDPYNYKTKRVSFSPRGLKTHKTCWPFSSFDDPTSFNVKFQEFFKYLEQNPRFENYESLFEEFPDLWEEILELDITLNAKTYNPVDHL
ncbi:hypothetical protein GOV13_04025 [Candidatus Pacearchaeota archaeon]|nr:hypothetical protein [Candidatus Pacearchaeota archaeon]